MGKHNRTGKYVGKHRAVYANRHVGKKVTGVLAFSTVVALTPQMLGYEVVRLPGMSSSAVIPPMVVEKGVIIADPPVDVLSAPG